MAQQAVVIEDYFSEGTNRMQQQKASPTNKKDSVVEAATVKPDDQEDKNEKNESSKGQRKDQQGKIMVEENGPQEIPEATEAADFLPFRRTVVETDTLLE
ncbi:unnamed protein product [Calypogeia fissa]